MSTAVLEPPTWHRGVSFSHDSSQVLQEQARHEQSHSCRAQKVGQVQRVVTGAASGQSATKP